MSARDQIREYQIAEPHISQQEIDYDRALMHKLVKLEVEEAQYTQPLYSIKLGAYNEIQLNQSNIADKQPHQSKVLMKQLGKKEVQKKDNFNYEVQQQKQKSNAHDLFMKDKKVLKLKNHQLWRSQGEKKAIIKEEYFDVKNINNFFFESDEQFNQQQIAKQQLENQYQTSLNKLEFKKNLQKNKKLKKRKIRTTITEQKLYDMNQIFTQYMEQRDAGKNPISNLKQIGQRLGLGYSTILHKFREFRATKKVKGGALIASLHKKRKYRKSKEIQKIIQKSLQQKAFYTAVELSKYIKETMNLNYSRSIISRHLGQMGYSYKNLKKTPVQRNQPQYKLMRKQYADVMGHERQRCKQFIYEDELTLSLANLVNNKKKTSPRNRANRRSYSEDAYTLSNQYQDSTELQDQNNNLQNKKISLLAIISKKCLLHYQIIYGIFHRQEFCCALNNFINKLEFHRQYKGSKIIKQCDGFFLVGNAKIHKDTYGINQQKIEQTLQKVGMQLIYVPPYTPQLNPVKNWFCKIKAILCRSDFTNIDELKDAVQKAVQKVNEEPIQSLFNECHRWMQKAQKEEDFF